jgi:Tol biopolymer transport system component
MHRAGSRWPRGLVPLALSLALGARGGEITRISVGPGGAEADGRSRVLNVSKSGRYVAFFSDATNLVANDTNAADDVFVYDRKRTSVARVSVSSDGAEGNGRSWSGQISGNGRYVVFHSEATNLVPGDTNGVRDVFVRDRKKGRTTRVSVSSAGAQGDGSSSWPVISGNGRFIGFTSTATNLVAGDTNDSGDIFVHDRKTGRTERVSVTSSGVQTTGAGSFISLSRSGRHVCWWSQAPDLVADDTNGVGDIFVRDRKKGTTERVSVSTAGVEADLDSPDCSMDPKGRYVAFVSQATNLVAGDTNGAQDVFLRDLAKGTTIRLSVSPTGEQGDADCFHPTFSPDGTWLSYVSWSTNLVPGDTNGLFDLFLLRLRTGDLQKVSMGYAGDQTNGDSWRPRPSKKAKYLAFYSLASNLVPGDTNGVEDVFLWRR